MYEILVVDDDYAVREMLQELLEDAGYRVAGAENGAHALTKLREAAQLPRLILLDMMMPVMSGWEFSAKQRADARLAAIPVIVLSARPGMHNEAGALAADGFLTKPININDLLAMVERYCA